MVQQRRVPNRPRRNHGSEAGEAEVVKLTLRQKREIMRRFKAGRSRLGIAWDAADLVDFPAATTINEREDAIEQIIRDFMNGKFTMKPRKRK